jgi:hypothetical protein
VEVDVSSIQDEKLIASDGAYTVGVLAAKVGKSVAYVYTRLTLTRLIPVRSSCRSVALSSV